MEQNKLGILIGLFLVGGIIAWLVLPMSFQDTTIILESGSGGAPVSCLPSGGFVLAQNLTDLCDVTIISPNTDQIIQYNGSQWVNVDSAFITTNATCSNLGTGTIICASDDNNIIGFKSLVELNGIDITNSSSEIFIRNTGVLSVNAGTGISVNQTNGNVLISNTATDSTDCNNIGTGNTFICVEGTNVDLRSLFNGTGIILSNNTNTITVTNSLPESTTGSNLGSGTGVFSANIFASEVGNDLQFKTLFNSDGNLSIQNWNSTHVRINNIFPESTVCTNLGTYGNDVINSGCDTKRLLGIKGISATNNSTNIIFNTNFANGTGISITGTTTQTFTNTGVTSLTSADTATLSFNASTGNVLATPTLKKLCEFTGVGGETSISCNFSSSAQVFSFQVHWNSSASSTTWALKFNNDSSSIYGSRSSTNGGADATVASQAFLASQTSTANQMNTYTMDCHNHMSTMIKWCVGDRMNIAPGANAPGRVEIYSTWRNVANNVTSIDMTRTAGAGTLIAGSHIIVWGYS